MPKARTDTIVSERTRVCPVRRSTRLASAQLRLRRHHPAQVRSECGAQWQPLRVVRPRTTAKPEGTISHFLYVSAHSCHVRCCPTICRVRCVQLVVRHSSVAVLKEIYECKDPQRSKHSAGALTEVTEPNASFFHTMVALVSVVRRRL
jgi:hypothetical protein